MVKAKNQAAGEKKVWWPKRVKKKNSENESMVTQNGQKKINETSKDNQSVVAQIDQNKNNDPPPT